MTITCYWKQYINAFVIILICYFYRFWFEFQSQKNHFNANICALLPIYQLGKWTRYRLNNITNVFLTLPCSVYHSFITTTSIALPLHYLHIHLKNTQIYIIIKTFIYIWHKVFSSDHTATKQMRINYEMLQQMTKVL